MRSEKEKAGDEALGLRASRDWHLSNCHHEVREGEGRRRGTGFESEQRLAPVKLSP